MAPQYLKNNHVTYYEITQVGVYAEQWYVIITSDVTWTEWAWSGAASRVNAS